MSLLSSMYTAANGLEAHSDAMGVVSDNIANVNTVGFKTSTARFSDIIAGTSASTTTVQSLGQGSQLGSIEESFTQGALLATGGVTDLALEGDGFFIVADSNGSYYTRAGQLSIDATGSLVNASGKVVQGYLANSQGVIQNGVTNLVIDPTAVIAPSATANATVSANLDSNAAVLAAFDVTNPGTTSNFSTSVDVYDSRGDAHNVDIYFRNTGNNVYEWHALVNGAEVTGGTSGVATDAANGTLTFNTDGSLQSMTTAANAFNFLNAVQAQTIAFNFGTPIATGGTGVSGVTSYAGASNVSTIGQDGWAQGSLAGVSVTQDGTIEGYFTNRSTVALGQIAIARFSNNEGLQRLGNSLWQQTLDSGDPAVGVASTGGRGSVAAGSLEQSNVNLSQEFINLMAYQRGFQANTRTVKTSDDMLQELVNLGR